ncbi:shikimate kinase [Mangrovibacillus cuniculi]|uniref:Shikimate kinase n=1 Tax=Mangrovibacillus cuniculi TaxID=2593652 RepID=A0A7S8CBC7_9BACI|nr:shikimate kinase [Mangrovibacillus cuniculi]QPC46855.1 shikimate kinase [Mangrovibacillus cuniculi]
MSIVFIGFMAAGKSTVGREFAEKCGKKWIDTDEWIEDTVGMKIPDIFAKKGETFFRQKEFEALCFALEHAEVITTGGGIIETEKCREVLRKHPNVYFLQAHPSVWRERLGDAASRPNANTRSRVELIQLYIRRLPWYEECSNTIIDTTKLSLEETMQRVESKFIGLNGAV